MLFNSYSAPTSCVSQDFHVMFPNHWKIWWHNVTLTINPDFRTNMMMAPEWNRKTWSADPKPNVHKMWPKGKYKISMRLNSCCYYPSRFRSLFRKLLPFTFDTLHKITGKKRKKNTISGLSIFFSCRKFSWYKFSWYKFMSTSDAIIHIIISMAKALGLLYQIGSVPEPLVMPAHWKVSICACPYVPLCSVCLCSNTHVHRCTMFPIWHLDLLSFFHVTQWTQMPWKMIPVLKAEEWKQHVSKEYNKVEWYSPYKAPNEHMLFILKHWTPRRNYLCVH